MRPYSGSDFFFYATLSHHSHNTHHIKWLLQCLRSNSSQKVYMRQLFKVPYPSNKGRALFYAELSLFVMLSSSLMIPASSVCFPCPISNCHFAKFLSASTWVFNHMFSVSLRTLIERHRWDLWIQAPTIWGREPLTMTGNSCLKSPPKTIDRPPNGLSEWRMSWKVLLTASCRKSPECLIRHGPS